MIAVLVEGDHGETRLEGGESGCGVCVRGDCDDCVSVDYVVDG